MPQLPWQQIDTVLLDMDGTLLDLHFDNHFWLTYLPKRLAELRGISLEAAMAELTPMFSQHAGTLNWYCTDFWSQSLNISIRELKREVAHLIAYRPHAEQFLQSIQGAGKQVVMITNAHRDSLTLKLERVQMAGYFQRLISSHDYGYPKEDPRFWQALEDDLQFDSARSLFIDDSLPVLRSAERYGIAHLLAVHLPDSKSAPKHTEEFAAVIDYPSLLQGL